MHLVKSSDRSQVKSFLLSSWALATTLIVSYFTGVERPSQAAIPEQMKVNEVLGNSSELVIRRSGRRESFQIGSVLQRLQDAIVTVPPNNARALLRFLDINDQDLNMYIQTIPHDESAIYYFPCQIEGGNELIGWGLVRDADRGCETGLRVSRGQRNRVQTEQSILPFWMSQSVKWLSQNAVSQNAVSQNGVAQGSVRRRFYCSTAGTNGSVGFAAVSSGDPCTKALQQCQDTGGLDCTVLTMGSWWSNEEQLYVSWDCGEASSPDAEPPPELLSPSPSASPPVFDTPSGEASASGVLDNDLDVLSDNPSAEIRTLPFSNWIEGTGETLDGLIESELQQPPTQFCGIHVYRFDDVVIFPAPDEVVLGLGDDETLVQAKDTPTGLQIDVLKGAVNVRSPSNRERDRQLVTAGQRYDQASTGNTITTFDQDAALTSINMEVLCAFASDPSNNLNVSACAEQNLLMPANDDGSLSYGYCNREQASGGQEGDQRTLQMSSESGEIKLEFEAFDVPDRFQIFYEGREILDTGPISYSDTLIIPFSGKSSRVDVVVTGNPGISTTLWNYTLYCPQPSIR